MSAEPSELRTFLFADIRGYTRFTQESGDEAAARLVVRFAALMRETVRARGGQVVELRGDEALAVFGSARQALRAAVDLQTHFAQQSESDPSLPLPVGIGLDAGEAVPLEGGYRGEALNLAARLCNLAGPGEVLATEGVVYLARRVHGITYAERGSMPIKGFAEPVRVIRVLAESEVSRDAVSAESPNGHTEAALPIGGFLGALPSGALVGRAQEWERIVGALEKVMQGAGQLVFLSGEPGIGKTRLAQEVTLKARHWGFLVATGRCYEYAQSVPYFPFLETLTTLYQACSPTIQADVPRRWPHLGRILPEQVGLIPVASQGEDDQHLLFRAVTGFVEAIAETMPLALLLDDLHWSDDSSLRLLQHLARYTRSYRVLLVGAYRDVDIDRHHPLEPALLDLGREQLLEEIEVRRLDQEGTAALMAEIMGGKEDLAELTELVYRRTDGNAFFIQEMLRAMIEGGDLYQENGRWIQRRVEEMEVPKSIRSLIGHRLARLEERSQDILREASVLGQEFHFDDLLALGAFIPPLVSARQHTAEQSSIWSEDVIEGTLEQAILAGLVRETGEDRFAFNHALTRQALYAELSTRRRKRIHLAAGQALERLPATERERRAGELAWHFLEGDDAERALPYVLLAGDQAERVFANREADRHYRTALELARELGDTRRETEALEKLAGVLSMGARYDQALEMLEQAAELHRDAGDREREAAAVAQMGHIHYLRDTAEEGIERLKPLIDALEADQGAAPPYGLAALWAAVALLYGDADRPKDALGAAERAIELARTLTDHPDAPKLLLGAEVTRSEALWRLGQSDEGLHVIEELIPRAEAANDLNNLMRALGNAANYYARRGELDKDREYHLRRLEISERRGDRGYMVLSDLALSTNAFLIGDWNQARLYLERAENVTRSLDTIHLSTWPLAARAWLLFREGDLAAAAAQAEELFSLTEGGNLMWRIHAQRLLAERDLLEGHPEAALARLLPFLAQPGARKDPGFLSTLAWAHLETGDDQAASDLAAYAVSRAARQNRQPELVEALVVQGMVAGRQRRWEEAERVLTDAISRARSVPFPFGEARALYQCGLVQDAKGEGGVARDRPLQEALAIFQRLGAKKDAERAEAALTPLP